MNPSMAQLHGLSRDKAELYGLPHLGARYVTASGRYEATAERCVVCGRRATNCHHVVPRSVGMTFQREVPAGRLMLRSPLFALCGSGTTGCHGAFHSGRLKARWVWDSEEAEEAWWSGDILSRHHAHDPAIFAYGHWEIDDTRAGLTVRREETGR